jgi:membrane fusion protein (multidrug efflux system)
LKVEDAGAALALRTGMSADVSIDTGASRGFSGLFGSAAAAE